MGTSTMARFLWVVQYFVANGFYVLVDYHPEPGNAEPVTDSVQVYSNNWLRLWAGLSCLPNYKQELQGRVFLDLLNGEPGTTGRGAWGLKIGFLVLNPKLMVDCSEWQHDSTWGGGYSRAQQPGAHDGACCSSGNGTQIQRLRYTYVGEQHCPVVLQVQCGSMP